MAVTDDFAASAQALAAALLAATTDPGDAVRVLSSLADFTPADVTTSSVIGTAQGEIQDACGDLFRRAALVALARATATYQPSSYDDAASVRTMVCDLLDGEITIAGDQGEDATYNALRALRVAVGQDLSTRGATLARIETVVTAAPQSALTLAYRLYADISRADELIAEADPVHPAFMPTSFKALAE